MCAKKVQIGQIEPWPNSYKVGNLTYDNGFQTENNMGLTLKIKKDPAT